MALQFMMSRVETVVARIASIDPLDDIAEDELAENETQLPLCEATTLNQSANIYQCTNHTLPEFKRLLGWTNQLFRIASRRGPKPKICDGDALFCLLMFYKSGANFVTLATLLKVKETAFKKAIDRTRPVLNATVRKMWMEQRKRPRIIDDAEGDLRYAALLLDSTSLQVYTDQKPDSRKPKRIMTGKITCMLSRKKLLYLLHLRTTRCSLVLLLSDPDMILHSFLPITMFIYPI